ncbi:MAG TPA: helix-turn-helix domain-containing protein [Fimbriimonadaceae bacterium]|nr:helix-turn-helix domain-containing protein [Fimbriimonadaceae bacterium]
MNLADAIRQAANHQSSAPAEPESSAFATEKPKLELKKNQEPQAYDAVTSEPVQMPEPPSPPGSGGVVRMELFLAPEQLSGLFRAIVGTQHSVMTSREAAAYLRINQGALEQMAAEGKIPAFVVDGRWRFPKSGIDEWLTLQTFRGEEKEDVA